MSDRVHPLIASQKKPPNSSTHFVCSQGPSEDSTHHLVPEGNVLRCKYCRKPDATIRKENGLA